MVQELYFTGVVSIKITATGFWMFLGFPRGLDGNEHGKIPLTLRFPKPTSRISAFLGASLE